ncbi:hypothetical protein TNCV_2990601 [Trichonephila clavipes]|nr:hypothetical protein TNCV_2990601 [Trichonephila clavipes]
MSSPGFELSPNGTAFSATDHYTGWATTLEHYGLQAIAPFPVGIWLMVSAECVGGLRAPTPQRCRSGCSLYHQCVLEGCGSKIQYHPKP